MQTAQSREQQTICHYEIPTKHAQRSHTAKSLWMDDMTLVESNEFETARKRALGDGKLYVTYTPSANLGTEQAKECRTRLAGTVQQHCLPAPTRACYVSPWTRTTLETTQYHFSIFNLDDIHLRGWPYCSLPIFHLSLFHSANFRSCLS
jgi:hypothetical protein